MKIPLFLLFSFFADREWIKNNSFCFCHTNTKEKKQLDGSSLFTACVDDSGRVANIRTISIWAIITCAN